MTLAPPSCCCAVGGPTNVTVSARTLTFSHKLCITVMNSHISFHDFRPKFGETSKMYGFTQCVNITDYEPNMTYNRLSVGEMRRVNTEYEILLCCEVNNLTILCLMLLAACFP